MSSLQHRVLESSGSTSAITAIASKRSSFENCFSAGLDLSEFAAASTQTHSAASDLMRIKAQEHQDEAELQKRIAQVHATKNSQAAPTYELSLRAENPHSSHTVGNERDNNFLQFDNGSNRADNGFISSLVQSHNSEKKEFGRSQRSLRSKKIASSKSTGVRGMNNKSRRGNKPGSGKKLSAKKATKSKF